MVWDSIRNNWPVIWALLMSCATIIQLLLAKTYARREELEKVSNRLSILEQAIEGMPTEQDLHNLHLEICSLRADIREFSGTVRQAARISDLLLENELKEKN